MPAPCSFAVKNMLSWRPTHVWKSQTRQRAVDCGRLLRVPARSEEHTSELQSLMRISYAVFCLKKKTKIHITAKFSRTNNSIQPIKVRLIYNKKKEVITEQECIHT